MAELYKRISDAEQFDRDGNHDAKGFRLREPNGELLLLLELANLRDKLATAQANGERLEKLVAHNADSTLIRPCPRCNRTQLGALMAGPGSEAYWHADGRRDDCSTTRAAEADQPGLSVKARDLQKLGHRWFEYGPRQYQHDETGRTVDWRNQPATPPHPKPEGGK